MISVNIQLILINYDKLLPLLNNRNLESIKLKN